MRDGNLQQTAKLVPNHLWQTSPDEIVLDNLSGEHGVSRVRGGRIRGLKNTSQQQSVDARGIESMDGLRPFEGS